MEDFDYKLIAEEEWPFAQNLASWISKNVVPDKVFDIGCGPGIYVEALRAEGILAKGFDTNNQLKDNPIVDNTSLFDIRDSCDLVLFLEVAEHIEFERSNDIISHLYRIIQPGGSIIFSAAQPGQGGVGHINCQPKDFWRWKMLAHKNMYENNIAYQSCYSHVTSGYHMGWFKNNFMIFTKGF